MKPRWRWDWRAEWWYRSTPETFEVLMKPSWKIKAWRPQWQRVSRTVSSTTDSP